MPKLAAEERVLALDVRRSTFGFAVFEGPDRLLDWGVHSFRGGANAVKVPPRKKLANLLDEYIPATLLVRGCPANAADARRALSIAAKRGAAKRGIRVRTVSREEINRTFADHRNKATIATALSIRFPELARMLPPKRKIWKSEDYRMKIFDAAATAIAHFTGKTKPRSA